MKKVNQRRIFRVAAILLTGCLLLSACGADGRAGTVGSAGPENNQSGNGSENNETDNNGSNGMSVSNSTAMITENKLYLQGRQNIQFHEPESGYQAMNYFFDVYDGKIYLFRPETPAQGGNAADRQRLCVQTFDSKTQAVEQYFLTPEVPGLTDYTFYSVGLTADGEISIKLFDLNGNENSYFLAKMDLAGNMLETADSFPDEAEYPWNMDFYSSQKAYHLADGRTVLSSWNMDTFTAVLTWFDGKSGQIITQIEGGTPQAVCCDADGLLYCLAGGVLLRLDPEKNTQDELFRLNENGIDFSVNFALFPVDEGMLLCRMDKDELLIYMLTAQKPVNKEEIVLSCPGGTDGMTYIQRKASTFSYDTEGLPIKLETAESEAYQEDYRNRIMAELAAGKGPDMLLLSRDDIALLADKGYLCDLSDLIPEDVKAQMIPSVLELGTVNGRLAAITPQVEFNTMITGNQTWEKDHWNISEFKELLESRDDWEMMFSFFNSNTDFYSLYYWMFGNGIINSPLLDLEQGISHLDSEDYVEILELCKKYSEKNVSLDGDEIDALLKEGKIAAKRVVIYDLVNFSTMMSRYGEDCHLVGTPSESGSGSYVEAYSFQYLAVNENSPHKEEIKNFLAYLLSYENQYTVEGCSVRLDVLRDSVTEHYNRYMIRRSADPDDNQFILLEDLKPDGTPWLEEFLDFVKSSEPAPDMPDELSAIIGSELQSFYEGGRSARETADNIHNRVQLYLDERK